MKSKRYIIGGLVIVIIAVISYVGYNSYFNNDTASTEAEHGDHGDHGQHENNKDQNLLIEVIGEDRIKSFRSKSQGIQNPIVTARTLVSFNFRPPQPMIDPDVNLVEADYSIFKSAGWILPLKE